MLRPLSLAILIFAGSISARAMPPGPPPPPEGPPFGALVHSLQLDAKQREVVAATLSDQRERTRAAHRQMMEVRDRIRGETLERLSKVLSAEQFYLFIEMSEGRRRPHHGLRRVQESPCRSLGNGRHYGACEYAHRGVQPPGFPALPGPALPHSRF